MKKFLSILLTVVLMLSWTVPVNAVDTITEVVEKTTLAEETVAVIDGTLPTIPEEVSETEPEMTEETVAEEIAVVSEPANLNLEQTVTSGTCGENLTWTLDAEGTLTISGTGAMEDYDPWGISTGENKGIHPPWTAYRPDITKVEIMPGITYIGQFAFNAMEDLTAITIPDTVTCFGENAFQECTNLASIIIPDSVTTIEACAFEGCYALSQIVIPGSVTTIGGAVFISCGPIEITFSGNVPAFAQNAFLEVAATCYYPANNSTWTSDVMQNYGGTITWVPYDNRPATSGVCGENLYWSLEDGVLIISGVGNMDNYSSSSVPWTECKDQIFVVSLQDGATNIGEGAFADLPALNRVFIPESVTEIGRAAFRNCTSLSAVKLSGSVTTISSSAFENCSSLQTVSLPENVTSICYKAFADCASLINVTFPENLGSIDECAFSSCSSLEEITFAGSAPTIANNAFVGVRVVAGYPVADGSWIPDVLQNYGGAITWVPYGGPAVSGICGDDVYWHYGAGGLMITGTGSMYNYGNTPAPWAGYKDQISSVEVESGVTSAGEGAFANLPELTQVSLPNTVTEIAYAAFRDCTSLPAVTLPDSVMTISYNAFQNCSSLQNVSLSANVTSICYDAFADCTSLSEVVFPESLQSIEDGAFGSCASLGEMTFAGSAPTIAGNAFAGIYATAGYPAADTSWTSNVLQNYGGTIHWVPYGNEHIHSFGAWVSDGSRQQRFCEICGYAEEKIIIDGDSVEIGSDEQPNLEFEVEPVRPDTADEKYILVEEAFSNTEQEILKVFDINLKNSDGVHVQPEGTVKVKLPLDWSKKGNYKVYRVNDNGTLTDMQAFRQGSHMVFETDHFSLYVIVEQNYTDLNVADVAVYSTGTITIPVSLNTKVTGTAMGLTYAYDDTVLEIIPGECEWVPDGQLRDFSPDGHQAVWGSDAEMELTGEICILTFRVLDMDALEETEVTCNVTVMKDAETVGTYQDSGRIVKVCMDVDGSGKVNESDAIYLIWHTLFPAEYPLQEKLVDFNADGKVTDADATLLLWYALFPE